MAVCSLAANQVPQRARAESGLRAGAYQLSFVPVPATCSAGKGGMAWPGAEHVSDRECDQKSPLRLGGYVGDKRWVAFIVNEREYPGHTHLLPHRYGMEALAPLTTYS